MPLPWRGALSTLSDPDLMWLHEIDHTVFCALWQRWPTLDLPPGHDFYVVSFHLEMIDLDWLQRQCALTSAPILLLSDLNLYQYPLPSNIIYVQYLSWHQQIEKIKSWFPDRRPRQTRYKASAFCNRITQSKMLIFTALAEILGPDQCMLKLDDWLEEKNVHFRTPTNDAVLDDLAETFWHKYWGKRFVIDDFSNVSHNMQRYTADPWHQALQSAAFNFTNESFHYSLMHERVLPGPFLTEKTLKCLVGGTPLIPVGQFDTLGTLRGLGCQFDYGVDLSWDSEPANIARLKGIVNTIQLMRDCAAEDLYQSARISTDHNQDLIWSGDFTRACQRRNDESVHTALVALT